MKIISGIRILGLFRSVSLGFTISELEWKSCSTGSYKVETEPFGQCAGFRECEPGFYCESGQRYLCPAGQYGAESGLTTPECSGQCSPGFYCEAGSTSPTAAACGGGGGGGGVYCPAGAGAPLPVPAGAYALAGAGAAAPCPAGSYCVGGVRRPCPAGTYSGLAAAEACAVCPAGHACPEGAAAPAPCAQRGAYCPEGAARPLTVDEGHYAVAAAAAEEGGGRTLFYAQKLCPQGHFCAGGAAQACPAGRFGAKQGETDPLCSGECWPGHYCPEGSIRADQEACGPPGVYCPGPGNAAPVAAPAGHYTWGDGGGANETDPWSVTHAHFGQSPCPPGHYCAGGVRRACPPGFYGAAAGLADPGCSGPCPAGFYCEEGATDPYANECGGADVFCPEGSAAPQPVGEGYLSAGGANATARTSERRCGPGSWCRGGRAFPCAAGFYGDAYGLTAENCTGLCAEGYFCPNGSSSATEVQCGDPSLYCPEGSAIPTEVEEGYYTVGGFDGNTRTGQVQASPGNYATKGLERTCPAGRYGDAWGQSDPSCTGPCRRGFYCPAGSTSPRQVACGGPDVYCPKGSAHPLPVTTGYYTSTTREEECPPGYFRNRTGVRDATRFAGPSAVATAVPQAPCDLCPEGTYKAVSGDRPSLCRPCDPWTADAVAGRRTCACRRLAGGGAAGVAALYFNASTGVCQNVTKDFVAPEEQATAQSIYTRHKQFGCKVGYYCQEGVRAPCQPGSYGALEYETNANCSGLCQAGYYCLEASASATQHRCGGAHLYCPEGSHAPIYADEGHYTDESVAPAVRGSQAVCPPGHYCTGGLRHKCPAGSFGATSGLNTSECSGICDRGHYCKAASTTPTQHQCGGVDMYCPPGSHKPTPVDEGFYTIHTGVDADRQSYWDQANATRSAQLLCEPGHYCRGGVKEPCPEGVYGWERGLTTRECSGPCSEGHYCPMGSTQANQDICGSTTQFCPEGTGESYIQSVQAGYYTVGGNDATNTTRVSEKQCEPGFFCQNGIKIRCPPGTFGSSSGLKSEMCSGFCPAGFYCPIGTSQPLECKWGQYSSAAAFECISCPGVDDTQTIPSIMEQICRDSRHCCAFY